MSPRRATDRILRRPRRPSAGFPAALLRSLRAIHRAAPNFRSILVLGHGRCVLPTPAYNHQTVDGVRLRDWVADLVAGRPVADLGRRYARPLRQSAAARLAAARAHSPTSVALPGSASDTRGRERPDHAQLPLGLVRRSGPRPRPVPRRQISLGVRRPAKSQTRAQPAVTDGIASGQYTLEHPNLQAFCEKEHRATTP
jgi:hypothetical protein